MANTRARRAGSDDDTGINAGIAGNGRDSLPPSRFLPTIAGLIELVALGALLAAAQSIWFAPGEFIKLEPHPYWLPVVLLSLQYGTADGLLAAVVAIFAIYLFDWPSQGVEENYYRYLVRATTLPVAWILCAIVVGEIRSRQRRQIWQLASTVTRTGIQAADITAHCGHLVEKIGRLERTLAIQEAHNLDVVIANIESLRSSGADAWRQAFLNAQNALFHGGSCALLLQHDDVLLPVLNSHMARSDTPGGGTLVLVSSPPITPSQELVENLLRGRAAFSILRPEEAPVLGDEALFAGAIRGSRHTAPLGILLIRSLDPALVTAQTERRFDWFCREVFAALFERGVADLIETSDAGVLAPTRKAIPALSSVVDDDHAVQPMFASPTVARFGRV